MTAAKKTKIFSLTVATSIETNLVSETHHASSYKHKKHELFSQQIHHTLANVTLRQQLQM